MISRQPEARGPTTYVGWREAVPALLASSGKPQREHRVEVRKVFMSPEKIRVLIADDNELFREGLISLLSEGESIDGVGQARDGYQAIEKTHVLRPDVILMDVSMPRMDGVSATRQIKA